MQSFSELLERLREEKRISKKDLAHRARLTPGYISLLTRGEREAPSEATVKALADALNLDVEARKDLYEAAGYPFYVASPSYPTTSISQKERTTDQPIRKIDDGGEAPDAESFYGRQRELAILKKWMVDDRCRIVSIMGIGGVGKSALTARLETQVESEFDYVFWRSLQNAPSLQSILEKSILFFSNQRNVDLPASEYEQISVLISYLRMYRCLLILDNYESVLQPHDRTGRYREGYEGYGMLLQRLGETTHQSSLLINSREKPREIIRMEGSTLPIRTLNVPGVNLEEARAILQYENVYAPDDGTWKWFIQLYDGNPLALKLVAASIRELFGGDIALFLQEGEPIFGDIYALLDQQFDRLSEPEKQLMYWLAIEGESTSVGELRENTVPPIAMKDLQETLNSLRRRSMINVVEGGRFSQQPAIKQYVLDRLIEAVCTEIEGKAPRLLESHALLKGQAKDYVRGSQMHLILEPVVDRLYALYGKEESERQVKSLIPILRQKRLKGLTSGYTAGNILNLLIRMNCDLRGLDLSQLVVWQAYLQGVELPEVNFKRADLARSVFTDSFGSIHSVALSSNGEQLAAGTANGEIRVWETASGQPTAILTLHTDWVRSVAFSPDGKYLASSSDDQTICLYDRSTGELKRLAEHKGRVYAIAFSTDSQQLISGSQDKTVRLWDINTGRCLKVLEGHEDRIWTVAFSDAGIIASGSEDQAIRIWNVDTGQCLRVLTGHNAPIWSVAFSSDRQMLASGSEDQTIRLWDTATGRCLRVLASDQGQGHTGWVRSVAFTPDRTTLISASDDRTIRLWDVNTGICRNTLSGHTNWVRSVAISLDGSVLASGSEDQTVRIWELETNRCRKTLQGHSICIYSVAFSPDGRLLASSDKEQNVCLWKAATGELLKTMRGHKNWIRSVTFSPDGRYLASGSEDQTVRLWSVSTGHCLHTLKHSDWVYSVAFSPDGRYLASASEDHKVHLWEVHTGQHVRALIGHTNWVITISFSPDGKLLASGSDDQTLHLWNVETGKTLGILQNQGGRILTVSFSPNGQLLASGSEDGNISLWNPQNLELVRTLEGHTSRIRTIAFSPDSSSLVSGSEDQSVRFWEVETGTCTGSVEDDSRVTCVSYRPDGQAIATSSYSGTIKLWDAQTQKYLATLRNDRPYEHMDITGATGLTTAQREKLKALGAIETEE